MSLALRSDDISGTRGHSRFDLLGAVLVISKTDRQRDRLEEFPPRSKSGSWSGLSSSPAVREEPIGRDEMAHEHSPNLTCTLQGTAR
jgi:hypothetical protein